MATKSVVTPLIVIVGPTASGKTALAIELAEQLGGEIVCADSRTVYKGMDIGTAKPTKAEQERVPHWGIDLVEPGQPFTVADFKQYAEDKISDIRARGRVPFLVGGSGLYVDAVIFGYEFGGQADPELRVSLESMSLNELQAYCTNNNVQLPENILNKRHVIRAIERQGQKLKRQSRPLQSTLVVGIATDKSVLRQRIANRSEQLFEQGVVDEAIILGKKYSLEHEAMTGNIYPLVQLYAKGEVSLEELKRQFLVLDWKLAKRQLTWFRRNPYIIWHTQQDAVAHIKSALATD